MIGVASYRIHYRSLATNRSKYFSKSCYDQPIRTVARTMTSSSRESSEPSIVAFDNNLKRMQRDGAAQSYQLWRSIASGESIHRQGVKSDIVDYDYFHREVCDRLMDRLDDIKREQGFPLALDIGAGPGHIYKVISSEDALDGIGGGIGGVRRLVELDSSFQMLHRDDDIPMGNDERIERKQRCETYKMVGSEEGPLNFPNGTFDLVLSCASMHRVNDLPGFLSEVKRVLKPDGCFLGALVGGSSLNELRSSLLLAELERDGGVSPRVGPFVDVADVGRLMSSAGFALPTIDVDTIRISYPNAMVLMEHLQRMGEGNACWNRKRGRTSLDTFLAASCIYDDMFRLENSEYGSNVTSEVEATAQIIYAIGWVPHDSQPKPKERGSATRKIGEKIT